MKYSPKLSFDMERLNNEVKGIKTKVEA